MGKLTDTKVRTAKPGRHVDGQGLHLQVKPSGARSWVLRVQHNGRREEIGLGGYPVVTLAEARERALDMRRIVKSGGNARAVRDKANVRIPSFREAAQAARDELGKAWADKTSEQFISSLEQHAYPKLGARSVDHIGTSDVIAVLAPIWTEKPQIARKVRHRVLQVLSFAKSHGWREQPVPDAAELRRGLAKQPKGSGFKAMPIDAVPAFVASQLAKGDSPARLAMLFAIVTGARSGEARQARWGQFDFDARLWKRPAEIMKAREAHSVTLNDAAVAILKRAEALKDGSGLVFPSVRSKVLSDAALGKMLRTAGRTETVHGFRSTFRDWAAERMPTVPAMVPEMALAHSVGSAVEKAYLRSDLLDQRRALLEAWGRFVAPSLSPSGSNVVELAPRAAQGGEA